MPGKKWQHHRPFIQPKRSEYNGINYGSMTEAARAMHLDDMLKLGEIAWWLRQVPISLGADRIYRFDFLVAEHNRTIGTNPEDGNQFEIYAEDVKGIKTRDFLIIEGLWGKYAPFPLHVVKRKGKKAWTVEVILGAAHAE